MIERTYDLTGRIHGEAQLGISEAEANQLRALLLSDTVESYGSYGWRTIRRAGSEAAVRSWGAPVLEQVSVAHVFTPLPGYRASAPHPANRYLL